MVVYAAVGMLCILTGADNRDTMEIRMIYVTATVAFRLDSFNQDSVSPGPKSFVAG